MKTYTPLGILLASVTFLLFGRAVGYDFVWDDIEVHLVENPFLNPPSWDNSVSFWTETYERLYIPVAYSLWGLLKIFALSLQLNEAAVYHFVNICLHAYNGILVMVLLRGLSCKNCYALIGALVFIVHPLQVESVAWISEFRGLVSAAFGFTALYFYLEKCRLRIESPVRNAVYLYSGLGWLLFVCAILSKPSAVVFVLFAGILGRYRFHLGIKEMAGDLWYWLIPVFAIVLVTTSVHTRDLEVPFFQRPMIWMDAVSFYIYKLVFPFSLAASYARTPYYVISNWWLYVGWIIPGLLTLFLVYHRKRYTVLSISGLLFIVGFLPVSGLVVFHFQYWSTVADRYLYLSMFGVSLFWADLLSRIDKNWGIAAIIGLMFIWAAQSSLIQIPVWKNNVTLWTHCINVTPLEYRSCYNRGTIYHRNGEIEKAIQDYSKSIRVNPLYAPAYNNRGTAYKDIGEYDKAIADYKHTIRLDATGAEAYNNLGTILYEREIKGQALQYYNKAIELNPDYADAYFNRGKLLFNLKEYKKSVSDLTRAIQLNPMKANYYNDRGSSFSETGEYVKSIADYSKAIEIQPDFAMAYQNRAITYCKMERYGDAASDVNLALRLGLDIDPMLLVFIRSKTHDSD